MNKLQASLPGAKIILLSTNPKRDQLAGKNAVGLTLADYAIGSRKFIESKGWDYIDVYSEFSKQAGSQLDTYLTDGVHPNDQGYQLWFEIMKGGFENRVS